MKNSSVSIVKIIVFIFFLFSLMVLVSQPRAEDNKTVDSPPRTPGGFPKILEDDEFPSQILYDTIGACFQGTVRWIVMSNPDLIGAIPNPKAQRAMVEHCFCVMDFIRKEFNYQEYIEKVSDLDWVGNLFMSKAAECVGKYETLPNFFMNVIPDNETKNVIPEDKPKDSQDEPPGLKPKESENGLPETIFQG